MLLYSNDGAIFISCFDTVSALCSFLTWCFLVGKTLKEFLYKHSSRFEDQILDLDPLTD